MFRRLPKASGVSTHFSMDGQHSKGGAMRTAWKGFLRFNLVTIPVGCAIPLSLALDRFK
jgi:hypothetical protein